jgi:hypothetical protein
MSRNLILGVLAAANASGGGSEPPAAASQIDTFNGSVAGTGGQNITYTNAPLGTAASGRVIYAIHTFFDGASATGPDAASVTVGGNAMTLLGSIYQAGSNTCGIGVWAYQDDGALGANADIVVTDVTTRSSRSIAVLTGSGGLPTALDEAAAAGSTFAVGSESLDTTGAECLLYVSKSQNGDDLPAPAPFTDGGDSFDENTNEWVIIGWDNSPSGSTETVTIPTGDTSLRYAYIGLALAAS